jgi:hypothetical protein
MSAGCQGEAADIITGAACVLSGFLCDGDAVCVGVGGSEDSAACGWEREALFEGGKVRSLVASGGVAGTVGGVLGWDAVSGEGADTVVARDPPPPSSAPQADVSSSSSSDSFLLVEFAALDRTGVSFSSTPIPSITLDGDADATSTIALPSAFLSATCLSPATTNGLR